MTGLAVWFVVCFIALGTAHPYRPAIPALRADANLTLVSASVVDRNDHFIPDLGRGDFRIYERGAEQRIVSFAIEDVPMSVAIVLDASGSMKDEMALVQDAVRTFSQTENAGDEYSVVTVRDHPELSLEFTRDSKAVLTQINKSEAHGTTALLDSVYLAANYLSNGSNPRRAILVISDGEDNHSRYTEAELLRLLRESGSTLYAIGVGMPGIATTYVPEGERQPTGRDILSELADETGGRYFEAANARELPRIMDRLDVRRQYVLGFAPVPLRADGKYHRVELKLSRRAAGRHLHAYWRPGYYAPVAR